MALFPHAERGPVKPIIPITSHNPDVQPQRPGYSVCIEPARLFLCDAKDATNGGHHGIGWAYGLTTCRGKVTVWESRGAAQVAADRVGGAVVTVPRWNGHVWVWEEVAAMVCTTAALEVIGVDPGVGNSVTVTVRATCDGCYRYVYEIAGVVG